MKFDFDTCTNGGDQRDQKTADGRTADGRAFQLYMVDSTCISNSQQMI